MIIQRSRTMIILHGDATIVQVTEWNHHRVWSTGVHTPWSVVQTYLPGVVLVTDDPDDLRDEMMDSMSQIYVVTTNHTVAADAVAGGAFCIASTFDEALWRLRDLPAHYAQVSE